MCNPPVLTEKIKTSQHGCILKRKPPNNSGYWNCDISADEHGAGVKCESAIPGFSRTKHI